MDIKGRHEVDGTRSAFGDAVEAKLGIALLGAVVEARITLQLFYPVDQPVSSPGM